MGPLLVLPGLVVYSRPLSVSEHNRTHTNDARWHEAIRCGTRASGLRPTFLAVAS